MVSCNLVGLEGNGMHVGSSLSCQCLERERQGRSQSCSSFSTSEPDMLESPVVRSMTREMIKLAWIKLGFSISRRPSDFLWKCSTQKSGFRKTPQPAMNHRHSAGAAHHWDLLAASPNVRDVKGEIFLQHEEVNLGCQS